mmetsp:Transcript_67025/g.106076  ORF Transcript_67025/g.106076 Transcript_67025/m.106076 type:complete len:297 (+) Transcript_67025:812-1702(+)
MVLHVRAATKFHVHADEKCLCYTHGVAGSSSDAAAENKTVFRRGRTVGVKADLLNLNLRLAPLPHGKLEQVIIQVIKGCLAIAPMSAWGIRIILHDCCIENDREKLRELSTKFDGACWVSAENLVAHLQQVCQSIVDNHWHADVQQRGNHPLRRTSKLACPLLARCTRFRCLVRLLHSSAKATGVYLVGNGQQITWPQTQLVGTELPLHRLDIPLATTQADARWQMLLHVVEASLEVFLGSGPIASCASAVSRGRSHIKPDRHKVCCFQVCDALGSLPTSALWKRRRARPQGFHLQ